MKKYEIIFGAMFIIVIFALGFASSQLYISYNTKNLYDGLRFVANNSQPIALETARQFDKYGDWVCINSKGMNFERCVEVALHECSHEVFAEIIEKHPEKIEEVMKLIENEN